MNQTLLLDHLQSLPTSAGIYKYLDKNGNLLYVGKAKNLKKRIKSYFKIIDNTILPRDNLSQRIRIMVSQIAYLDTLLVSSEQDALILENSLIKSLHPKYNILLRDDKTYPYITYDKNASFPRLEIIREIKQFKKLNSDNIASQMVYYGPYCTGSRELLDSIYEILPLVQKKNCLKYKKACMFYQIDKCLAPCEDKISKEQYATIFKEALNYIDKVDMLISKLEEKMLKYSNMEKFEEAIALRDRIEKLRSLSKNRSIIDRISNENIDIFYLYDNGEDAKSVLIKLFIRDGKVTSSDYVFVDNNIELEGVESIYKQALINHYSANRYHAPDIILLPEDATIQQESLSAIKEMLKSILDCKYAPKIIQPKIGDKKELITLARNNAIEILRVQNAKNYEENLTLNAIKELFSLNRIPYSIEVFDTSHHAGKDSVGGLVAYENGAFKKDSYRHYILEGRDEYAQFSEMISRRLKLSNIDKNTMDELPNLWILDGGIAQLNLVKLLTESKGVNIDIIAISKEKVAKDAHLRSRRSKGGAKDIIHCLINDEHKEFKLNINDKRLQFCQKLRDEAHRWAITFHRKKKLQSMIPTSPKEKK